MTFFVNETGLRKGISAGRSALWVVRVEKCPHFGRHAKPTTATRYADRPKHGFVLPPAISPTKYTTRIRIKRLFVKAALPCRFLEIAAAGLECTYPLRPMCLPNPASPLRLKMSALPKMTLRALRQIKRIEPAKRGLNFFLSIKLRAVGVLGTRIANVSADCGIMSPVGRYKPKMRLVRACDFYTHIHSYPPY